MRGVSVIRRSLRRCLIIKLLYNGQMSRMTRLGFHDGRSILEGNVPLRLVYLAIVTLSFLFKKTTSILAAPGKNFRVLLATRVCHACRLVNSLERAVRAYAARLYIYALRDARSPGG